MKTKYEKELKMKKEELIEYKDGVKDCFKGIASDILKPMFKLLFTIHFSAPLVFARVCYLSKFIETMPSILEIISIIYVVISSIIAMAQVGVIFDDEFGIDYIKEFFESFDFEWISGLFYCLKEIKKTKKDIKKIEKKIKSSGETIIPLEVKPLDAVISTEKLITLPIQTTIKDEITMQMESLIILAKGLSAERQLFYYTQITQLLDQYLETRSELQEKKVDSKTYDSLMEILHKYFKSALDLIEKCIKDELGSSTLSAPKVRVLEKK